MSAATLFRIVYTSFYFLLYIVLVVLLLVTPADIIYQALKGAEPQTFFVIVIAAAYFTTTFIVVFVYSGRLYINRSVLASIPKTWIPIDKSDVPAAVRKIINAGLSRSAAIAYYARPRAPPVPQPGVFDDRQSYRPYTAGQSSGLWSPPPHQQEQQQQQQQQPNGSTGAEQKESKEARVKLKFLKLKKTPTAEDELGINLPPHKPVWGEVEHNGWGSPLSPDFPSLEYATVVSELPHLIEAKALTLAPPDPTSTMPPDSDGASAAPTMFQPDPDAVALLQRGNLALRDYLSALAELGVLPTPSQIAGEFLAAYEQARFSTRPLSARAFRELMRLFADLLRSMKPLDPATLFTDEDEDDHSSSYSGRGGGRGDVDVDLDDEAPAATATPSTMGGANGRAAANGDVDAVQRGGGSRASSPGARSSRTASSAGGYTTSSSSSSSSGRSQLRHHHRHRRRRAHAATAGRASSSHTWSQYRTAPNTPRMERTVAEAVAAAVVAARDAEGRDVQVVGGDETSVLSALESDGPQPAGSDSSFAQTRHPYAVGQGSSGGMVSLASSGSVVRFRDR